MAIYKVIPASTPSEQPNTISNSTYGHFSARFCFVLMLTGLVTGLVGSLLMKLLRLMQHIAWNYNSGPFLTAVEQASNHRRFFVLFSGGVLAGAALWAFARGNFRERGLTRAIWRNDGELPLFSTLYKGVLSIIVVGLGAAVGREAAPKEIGAAFAARFSDLMQLSTKQRRLLVASGAGAGMAAIYNVPFGGALFALEVLLGSLTLADALPVFATCFIATVTSWLLLPAAPTYIMPLYPTTANLMVFSTVFGPVAGVASFFYIRLIGKVRHAKPKGFNQLFMPPLVFAALGVAAFQFPALLGNGKNIVQDAIDVKIALPMLAILLLLRPLATAACLRAGIPGGLFTPTLTLGAVLGSLLGLIWMRIMPGNLADMTGAYAVIGAGAILSAATQGPLSSIALMLELGSNSSSLIMPLLIASAGATLVSRYFDPNSIYSIDGKSHPTLETQIRE